MLDSIRVMLFLIQHFCVLATCKSFCLESHSAFVDTTKVWLYKLGENHFCRFLLCQEQAGIFAFLSRVIHTEKDPFSMANNAFRHSEDPSRKETIRRGSAGLLLTRRKAHRSKPRHRTQ